MASPASTMDVVINIAFQTINIALFFWVLIRYLWKPLNEALQARAAKEKKLAEADAMYIELMNQAKQEKDMVIKQALEQKNSILQEAKLLAEKKESEILDKAQRKVDDMISKTQTSLDTMKYELENNFMSSVKHVAGLVVKKLVWSDTWLQDNYLDNLVQEFNSSKK